MQTDGPHRPEAATPADAIEDDDFEWLEMTNFSEHAGKYLSVVGRDVVAIGDTLHEVVQAARLKYPGRTPMAIRVPTPTTYAI